MADLRFFLSNHNDEKQSETKVEYETVERIDKIITLIDYREQKDKFMNQQCVSLKLIGERQEVFFLCKLEKVQE